MMNSDVALSTMDIPILLECLKANNVAGEEILKATGIDPSEIDTSDFEVSLSKVIKLWEFTANVTGDPAIGIHLRKNFGHQFIHFVNHIALNSRNVLEALQHYLRYGRLFSQAFIYDFRIENGSAIFTFTITSPRHLNGWIPEFHLSLPVHLVEIYGAMNMVYKEIHFQHICPTDERIYQDFFKSPVYFKQAENAIIMDKEILEHELPRRNPHLQAILKKQADVALENLRITDSLSRNVEEFILQKLGTGNLDIEMAANALNMHRTTLHRKLKENGTSFNKLLVEIRQNLSKLYLKQGMSIDQIAYLLDYANRSGFQYAFKSWFGQTPGEFRQQAR